MHLTEVTRLGAALTEQGATNASHHAVIRLLARIVLALLHRPHEQGQLFNITSLKPYDLYSISTTQTADIAGSHDPLAKVLHC